MRPDIGQGAFFLSTVDDSTKGRMAIKFREFLDSAVSSEPHYMVIGHPITHSLSPLMHQCALDFHRIEAKYYAIDLPLDEISSFIAWCNSDSFLGANITIPYKELLIEAVDKTDPISAHLGVINTICKEKGVLKGYNTDLYGFLKPLEEYRDELEGGSAIVFGSGGASKAVIAGLIESGIDQITIVSRNPAKRKYSDSNIGTLIRCVNYSNWHAFAEEAVVIVNTTPLGMAPKIDGSPVDGNEGHLLKEKICYDLVYNPLKTNFLKIAEANGGESVNGLDMLIWQGSRSFELWTGKTFPYHKVKEVLSEYFER